MTKNKLWPILEAEKILEHIEKKSQKKDYILFGTGYGPSGLPHIGTYGEIVRTNFVKKAVEKLAPNIKTKLLVVSDDFDSMRKVPDNIPNKDMLSKYIGKPLIDIPSPFGGSETYGEYMNNKLKKFLDQFNFEYEFLSSSKAYRTGIFDEHLTIAAEKYNELTKIMLPTLGEERRKTYSPFLPVDFSNNTILTEGVISVDPKSQIITFKNHKNEIQKQKFTSGGCKLQWKCDFGMRWASLGVDYEIYGKDHYPNEKIYRTICKTLGGTPPVNFFYELFLDSEGNKISKSKGNGVTIEQWMKYSNKDVLSLYMFQKPRMAKRLSLDVIAKTFDNYLDLLKNHNSKQSEELSDPIAFIHNDEMGEINISFSLIVNLISGCNSSNENIIWPFLTKYNSSLKKGKSKLLDNIVLSAINYYKDVIEGGKNYHLPSKEEIVLLEKLKNKLIEVQNNKELLSLDKADLCVQIQNRVYQIANDIGMNQKEWFSLLYKTLLGTENGPRMGSFIGIYGISETIDLIEKSISGLLSK